MAAKNQPATAAASLPEEETAPGNVLLNKAEQQMRFALKLDLE
jgi:hypothetical protein